MILKIILDKGVILCVKILRFVDLNKVIVFNLIDELIKEGYVIEKGYGKFKGGRRLVFL